MNPTNFSFHLSEYLTKYLPAQLGAATNTIKSYRDTFVILLRYLKRNKGILPEKLRLEDFSKDLINDFLIWLENERNCGTSTRNQRLSAIQSFFRYLQIESPAHIFVCQQILSISIKRSPKPLINYLSIEGIKSIISIPDTNKKSGRRDFVLLCLLYDTGARVQEIADCVINDIRLTEPATIRLTGKGSKSRIVPIMSKTLTYLKKYLEENNLDEQDNSSHPLFYNRKSEKLTRAGINYILNKYVEYARILTPELIPESVSPHCLRHSKAMHLLQSGVNLIYIRDLLGHVDIKTTEIYARADSKMKRQALENAYEKLKTDDTEYFTWKEDKELLSWLQNLCHS
jgi:site-specific recombinase XerD